jgi:transcriptional repressor NrdR
MICIYCNKSDTFVRNSRGTKGAGTGNTVWRRRFCKKCELTFTTYEKAFPFNLSVEKRDGRKVRYYREKLLTSIFRAFDFGKGTDAGDNTVLATECLTTIELLLMKRDEKVVSTDELIRMTFREMEKRSFDAAERYRMYSNFRSRALER